ncbi:MAG: exo-alpha-sialidase [Burkholderiales bacterium]|nr:MAG: exo-alpha-sialidase [Burkholderiales bacterium]
MGPPSGGFEWRHVTTPTVQAAPNTGYVLDTVTRTTVTLPAAPAVGDVLRLTGAGAGGWELAQNAGQRVFAGYGRASWARRGPVMPWTGVASSADGMRLAASASGGIHLSTDRGATWSVSSAPATYYSQIVSSADGTHLMALQGQRIWLSPDAGTTWTENGTAGVRAFVAITISADGSRLAAAEYGAYVQTSDDFGATWTLRTSGGGHTWSGLASSADGLRLVGVDANGGGAVYASADGGVSWAPLPAPPRDWGGVAMSADGSQLVASVRNGGGGLYVSTDSGLTWQERTHVTGPWWSVSSSADGRTLAATIESFSSHFGPSEPGLVYLSTDAGATWIAQPTTGYWVGAAISADGMTLAAVSNDGFLAVPRAASTAGTSGAVAGGLYDALAIQYLGGGLFAFIEHEGSPTVR